MVGPTVVGIGRTSLDRFIIAMNGGLCLTHWMGFELPKHKDLDSFRERRLVSVSGQDVIESVGQHAAPPAVTQ